MILLKQSQKLPSVVATGAALGMENPPVKDIWIENDYRNWDTGSDNICQSPVIW